MPVWHGSVSDQMCLDLRGEANNRSSYDMELHAKSSSFCLKRSMSILSTAGPGCVLKARFDFRCDSGGSLADRLPRLQIIHQGVVALGQKGSVACYHK